MTGSDGKRRGRPKQSSEIPLSRCRPLDRDCDVPLYYQLAATLFENFESGVWPPGARFATERELEEHFGVSRAVVRRALGLLVGDGAIVRRKGKGAFVAPRRRKIAVFGLIDALAGNHQGVEITVFAAREQSPDPAIANLLDIDPERVRVAHVTAVLGIEGQSVGIVDSHTPLALVPWVLDAVETLREGDAPQVPARLELTCADVMIEHTAFGNWGGPKVGAKAGDPALMTRFIQFGRIARHKQERPLEFARLIYPSNTTQVTFELKR